jgi:NAD(P)-dependent dehydrogenase (short-subunit alcohol dehydrogenase family)
MNANKVAIVTGASREIGAAICAALAADGMRIVLSHSGEDALARQHAAAIRAAGGEVHVFEADVSKAAECQALADFAVASYGRIDAMIANAGITVFAPFLETDPEIYDRVFDINVRGAYFSAQAAARQMVAQGQGGRILFSSSVAGIRAAPGLSAYGVTKGALRQMARTLSAELGKYKITVNALGIGAVLNERNLKIDADYAEKWGTMNPLGRVIQPEDVANMARFLCSDAAAMVSGQTLLVDGGWTMGGVTSPAKPI